MKLFLNQIEARRKLERTALDLELEEGAERMGLKRRAHASTPHTGNVAICCDASARNLANDVVDALVKASHSETA